MENVIFLSIAFGFLSIPHEAGLEALRFFLEDELGLPATQIKFIVQLAEFILNHNYFDFMC